MSHFITLSNGQKCPQVGLGTFTPQDPASVWPSILTSAIVDIGYRHLDTAELYKNEAVLGETLKSLPIPREELFITTKIWVTSYRQPVVDTLKRQLADLKLDYVDLYLVHSPVSFHDDPVTKERIADTDICFLDVWKGMEEVQRLGLAKSIGVSNFGERNLTKLLANCSIKPVMNQIESHPYNSNSKLIEFCHKNGIAVTAFCPFGNPPFKAGVLGGRNVFTDERIAAIAQKYGKTNAQVVMRWHLQRGICVIPKSSSLERLKQNFNAWDFDLAPEDMAKMEALNENLWLVSLAYVPSILAHPDSPFS